MIANKPVQDVHSDKVHRGTWDRCGHSWQFADVGLHQWWHNATDDQSCSLYFQWHSSHQCDGSLLLKSDTHDPLQSPKYITVFSFLLLQFIHIHTISGKKPTVYPTHNFNKSMDIFISFGMNYPYTLFTKNAQNLPGKFTASRNNWNRKHKFNFIVKILRFLLLY